MLAADPPAAVATGSVEKPAEASVVSRDARDEVIVSSDVPLPLVRGRRTEDAVLRHAIFLKSTLIVVRPAAGPDILRWTYEPYLQRQLCFHSITGQFSCAAAEVDALSERAQGEAPVAATSGKRVPVSSAEAEGARLSLAAAIHDRADELFNEDRRLKILPMLQAAGVSIRRPFRSLSDRADQARDPR